MKSDEETGVVAWIYSWLESRWFEILDMDTEEFPEQYIRGVMDGFSDARNLAEGAVKSYRESREYNERKRSEE